MKTFLLLCLLFPVVGKGQDLVRHFFSHQTLQGKVGTKHMTLVEKPLWVAWMKDEKGEYIDFLSHHYYIASTTEKNQVLTLNLTEGGTATWVKNLNQFVVYLPQKNLQWNMMACTYAVGY